MPSAGAALSAKIVFSNKIYRGMAAAIAAAFWVIINVFDGLFFLSPLNFYYPIPSDAIPSFILSNITAPLIGIIVSMNAYLFKNSKDWMGKPSFLSGSTLGTVSSMCMGCSSVGFYLATTFGTAGVAASTFLSSYQLPLRLLAIGLLVWAYYSIHRRITKSCTLT